MTPRWKIRRGWVFPYNRYVWTVYLDGERMANYVKWENALLHVEHEWPAA